MFCRSKYGIACLLHGLMRRCVKYILAQVAAIEDEENAKWSKSILKPSEIRARVEEESLKGEWHRTPENTDKILKLLHRVYGGEYVYMVAHHILIQVPDQQKPMEIPSAETLFFDPNFLKGLTGGESWEDCAKKLALLSQQGKLDYLYAMVVEVSQ